MAWTSPPRTWTTNELVTAAMMNTHVRDQFSFLETIDGSSNTDSRTFTNTGYLDLDALTGGAGTITAVAVTVTTGTRVLVTVAGQVTNSGGQTFLSYRVSGATTLAASDSTALWVNATAVGFGASFESLLETLNAGSNTFELQAKVSASTGTLNDPRLIVKPIPG